MFTAKLTPTTLVYLIIALVGTAALFGVFLEVRRSLMPMDIYEMQHAETMAKYALKSKQIDAKARVSDHPSLYYVDVSMAVFWRILPIIVVVGVGVWYFRQPVEFEYLGVVKTKVSRRDIPGVTETALRVTLATEVGKAQMVQYELNKSNMEQLIKFSHAIRPTGRGVISGLPVEGVGSPSQLALAAPNRVTLQTLIDNGSMGYGQPLMLGVDGVGEMEQRDWRGIKTMAIGGLQGSGKTLGTAYFVGSFVVNAGAEAFIIDPHKNHGEGLHSKLSAFVERKAITSIPPFEVKTALDEFCARIQARIDGEESSDRPLLIVIDELARLTKTEEAFPSLIKLLEMATEETRKTNTIVVGTSPKWTARYFNNRADFRDSMNTKCLFRMNKDAARMLTDDRDEQKLLRQVTEPGQFLFLPEDKGGRILTVPYVTADSLRALAAMAKPMTRRGDERPCVEQRASISNCCDTEPFAQQFEALKRHYTLEDIWRHSGLDKNITLQTFLSKGKPSGGRCFSNEEQAAMMGIEI